MTQFHVYRLPGGPLVIDLQSDLVTTGIRVVAPLVRAGSIRKNIAHLEPVFEIEDEPFALHAGELAPVPARLVEGRPVADLRNEDYAIRRALDMLFSGF